MRRPAELVCRPYACPLFGTLGVIPAVPILLPQDLLQFPVQNRQPSLLVIEKERLIRCPTPREHATHMRHTKPGVFRILAPCFGITQGDPQEFPPPARDGVLIDTHRAWSRWKGPIPVMLYDLGPRHAGSTGSVR